MEYQLVKFAGFWFAAKTSEGKVNVQKVFHGLLLYTDAALL